MKNIQLGLDIGTQFCWVGYFDAQDKKFISLLPKDSKYKNGIPTQVAYGKKNAHEGCTLKFGFEAEDAVKNDSRFQYINKGDDINSSIKTIMRNQPIEALADFNIKNEYVFKKFIEYVKENTLDRYNTKNNDVLIVEKVVLGYPNNKENSESLTYMRAFAEIVKQVFGCEAECHREASLAAFLAVNLYSAYDKYRKILTIDVGAGTTDFALVGYSEVERNIECFKVEPENSYNFGGKYLDDVISGVFTSTRVEGALNFIGYKKWLYDQDDEDAFPLAGYNTPKEAKRRLNWDNHESKWIDIIKAALDSFKRKIKGKGIYLDDDEKIYVFIMGGSCVLPFIVKTIKNFLEDNQNYFYKEPTCISSLNIAENLGVTNSNFISLAAAAYGACGALYKDAVPAFKNARKHLGLPYEDDEEKKAMIVGAPAYYALRDISHKYYLVADIIPQKGVSFYLAVNSWNCAKSSFEIKKVDYNEHKDRYPDYMIKENVENDEVYILYKLADKFSLGKSFIYTLHLKNENRPLPVKINSEGYTKTELEDYCDIEPVGENFIGYKEEANDNELHYIGLVYDYDKGDNNALSVYIFPKDENKEVTYSVNGESYSGYCYCDPSAGQDINMTLQKFKKLEKLSKNAGQDQKMRQEEAKRKAEEESKAREAEEAKKKAEKERKAREAEETKQKADAIKVVKGCINDLNSAINSAKKRTIHWIKKKRAMSNANTALYELQNLLDDLNGGSTSFYISSVVLCQIDARKAIEELEKLTKD